MAEMGDGYGSEFHLLRYLGRHRTTFNEGVLRVVKGGSVGWLDFQFDGATAFGDSELKGLDFLPPDDPVRSEWAKFWPSKGSPPNWDAIGKVDRGGQSEWLLVEAKGNLQELESSCGADPEKSGFARISRTFDETKAKFEIDQKRDWLNGYYQYSNRLSVLDFLNSHGRPAGLLLVYFTGDRESPGRTCPTDEQGWADALAAQDRHLGIGRDNPLTSRVFKIFLPANVGVGRRSRTR